MFNLTSPRIRSFSVAALAALVLSLAGGPATAEDFNFPGLSSTVKVYENVLGIPTIVGANENDVAFVQGYFQARDRFFQLDFFRKAAQGRLAELLGSDALEDDILLRQIGLGRAALTTWQALDPELKGILQSFANGINAYLATGPLPPEYTVLELTTTEPWTPLDTVGAAKVFEWNLGFELDDIDLTIGLGTYQFVGNLAGFDGTALFFEDTHRVEPADGRLTVPGFLGSIGGIGASSTEAAGGGVSKTAAALDPQQVPEVSESVLGMATELLDRWNGLRETVSPWLVDSSSNFWMVSGEHTDTGHAMIANDIHQGLNAPAQFQEVNLVYGSGEDGWVASGISFPAAPGIVQGCTTFLCWGSTVSPIDDTDFFNEQILVNTFGLPTHTVHNGVPEPLQAIFQSYYVNPVGDGVADNIVKAPVGLTEGGVTLVVPRRNNGAILNIDSENMTALSFAWTGSGVSRLLEAFRDMVKAKSMEEFTAALQLYDSGSQNIGYADTDGNIAYFHPCEVPIRSDLQAGTVGGGIPPFLIRDGSGALNHDWMPLANPQPNQSLAFEIMPFDEMPHVVNPASGYIANANNDPIGLTLDNNPLNQLRPGGGIYYINPGFAQGYRMGRIDRTIKAWLDTDQPVSLGHMRALQGNDQALDAELILPMLLPAFEGLQLPPQHPIAQALDVFSTWDYSTPTGIAEGFDAGDDPFTMTEPDMTEIRHSAAATIFAVWRSRLIANTVDAVLEAAQLGAYRPPGSLAWNAFKHHLENYATTGGVGASGLPFFSQGFEATVQGSLQQALELLASDEFAPAFGNSQNVLDYRWGKLHRIVFDHVFNADPFNVPNGGGFMDLAPGMPGIARQGGYEVVDDSDANPRGSTLNGFMFGGGPARRFLGNMDPAGVEAYEVIAGGQSGIMLHPNYFSQLPMWLTNNYHPLAIGEAAGMSQAYFTHTFGPPLSVPESTDIPAVRFSPLQPGLDPRSIMPTDDRRGDTAGTEALRLQR
jgi:penicillin amidase